MEIRTTNPELEAIISFLAENNQNGILWVFARKCGQIIPSDPYGDIPLISIEQDPQQSSDYERFKEELLPFTPTEHSVRVVGVQKCQDPVAAAFLSRESAYHPIAKLAALQSAYWTREFVILNGMKKGNTLEEILEMVNRASALQIKYLRREITLVRRTQMLPKELRQRRGPRKTENK